MSIVTEAGLQVRLERPVPTPPREIRSQKTRSRYRHWLERTRSEGLSARELARSLGKPASTVCAGIRWALQEEDWSEMVVVQSLQFEVLDERNGLDVMDLLYLLEVFPADSEIGSLPEFVAYMAPLVSLAESMYPSLGDLSARFRPAPDVVVLTTPPSANVPATLPAARAA